MISYAFWNNKGGVGKSFLCFVAACEYAQKNPQIDVYVVDLCPQANLTETLLGGQGKGSKQLDKLLSQPVRSSIAGYLEARLSSPFLQLPSIEQFVVQPNKYNPNIPKNVYLVCGDNLVEVISDAIRQASLLVLPADAWSKVIKWVKDLVNQLGTRSGDRDSVAFIDCNPSFSIYTQQALTAADRLIVPFTPDESSRRGIENVVVLIYGLGGTALSPYLPISFSSKAASQGVELPKLSLFVSNRVTFYDGNPSKAFAAASKAIKETVDEIYKKKKSLFTDNTSNPSQKFLDIPDNHSANVVCALTGTPLNKLKAGPHDVRGERIQVSPRPLSRYKTALTNFVNQL
jgi:cellulose biosynthesis protein BcsQ